MALTDTRIAHERTGNSRAYIAFRNALAKEFRSKFDERESIMAIIFNLLPEEGREDIAIVRGGSHAEARPRRPVLAERSKPVRSHASPEPFRPGKRRIPICQ